MINWNYLFEVSICWVIFYGFYVFFLKNETHFRFNRGYLLLTLIAGALLPLLRFQVPGLDYGPVMLEGIYSGVLSTIEIAEAAGSDNGSWLPLLRAVYWTGISVSAIIFLTGLFRVLLYLKRGVVERKHDHWLVTTDHEHAPFSFHRLLFISSGSVLSPEENEQVIRHELAHIREGHSFDVLLTEAFRILLWFHPFVYLYQKSIRNTHEFLADAAVLETTPKARYGRLLLEQSLSGPHLVNHFNKSQLKQRLIMMTRKKSSRLALSKYAFALPLFAICLFLFSFDTVKLQSLPDTGDTTEKTIEGEVDEMPRFPGCEEVEGSLKEKQSCAMNKMITFIGQNLKYPADARKKGVEGMVVVSFVVDENGSIKKTSIAKSLHDACDKEAMRVVAQMPNWIPGKKDGKPVPVEMKLPFKFKL